MKKVSLMDVAAAAGVSHATVARVIHKRGSVSPKTKELVEQKIHELGYIPNQMARTLKSHSSGIIGSLFVHNASGLIHQINESIAKAVQAEGYELLVIETQNGNEDAAIRNFLSLQADGIVIISDPFVSPELLEQLHKLAVPVVTVERGYHAQGVDNVLVKDYDACYQIGKAIAAQWHRRVALIEVKELFSCQNTPELNVEYLRRTGFLQGLEDEGITIPPEQIITVDTYSTKKAYEATERLLNLPEPPTAIFATADRLVAGVLQCLYDHHLRVPKDMSIVGYDNVLSARLSPPTNSVSLVYENVGKNVMSLLHRRMANPNAEPLTMAIDTQYIDRGTLTFV